MPVVRMFYILLLACCTLPAQVTANKGEILGTVYDANQAVVPGAKVSVKNVATGVTRELTTDQSGRYRAVLLDPGTYEISVQSAGFAPATVQGVVVNVGQSATVDITLQVQAVATVVEVGETLINIQLPTQSTVVNATAIENLPINGRRFQDFATLTPTVQVDPQRGQLSFVGQRGIYSNVMLDGADYNQPFFGGIRGGERSNFAFTIPQSAIQEFQVIAAGYSAEYGRSTGGILNTITKSGSNDIRGDAFYQLRHKELSARNPITRAPGTETLQQFGGSVGGPGIKDRLFWFAAAEQQFFKQPRTVIFSGIQTFTPTPATQEALNFLRSLTGRFQYTNNATAVTGRADYAFLKGHRLTMRYNHSRNDSENGVTTGTSVSAVTNNAVSTEGKELDRTHTGTVQYTHLFGPTIVNDLRFQAAKEIRPREANVLAPNVNISAIGQWGTRNFFPTTQDDMRWQIVNSLAIVRGGNNFKLGFDYNRTTVFQKFGFNQFGTFRYNTSNIADILDSLTPGGALNRFELNQITYSRQIGNLLADFGIHQLALFAQDSWRVQDRLTLDFGLRWEGQWNPTPEANNTDLVNRLRSAQFLLGRFDPGKIPNSLRQFMPRFGFAWTPIRGAHTTVVRGHAGLFYGATPMIVFANSMNAFRNPPGDLSISIIPGMGQTLYGIFRQAGFDLNQGDLASLPVIPLDVVQRAAAIAAGGAAPDPFRGADVIAVASDFRNPRSFQSGLGVESELMRNFSAGIQLNYVNSVHLLRNRDYNLSPPSPAGADQRPTYNRALRPLPYLNRILIRESNARSMYRGITFSAQYRVRRWQWGAFYTLSETFSDDDSERDATTINYDNAYNLRPEYWYSRLDARHQFAFNSVVTLPWGFEASGIIRTRSGLPIDPIVGSDANLDSSSFADRGYEAPGKSFLRHSFRNRGIFNADIRVLKNWRLRGERTRLQLSAEIFNLFNNENIVYAFNGNQNQSVYGRGAGAPVDARFMRLKLPDGSYDPANLQIGNPLQVQFGLRYFF